MFPMGMKPAETCDDGQGHPFAVCATCKQPCYSLPKRESLDPSLVTYCSVEHRPVADTRDLIDPSGVDAQRLRVRT